MVSRFDGHFADTGNGVPRVDAEVGENLIDLAGVDLHRPDALSRKPFESDILPDQPFQHPGHARQRLVEVDHLGHYRLFPCKGEELPGQVGRTLARISDFRQIGM